MKPMQYTQKVIQHIKDRVNESLEEEKYREIASKYDLHGYKRIYLFHIRKTGGTSLNNMFLSRSGGDSAALYRQLTQTSSHRLTENGLIYVGWNHRLLKKGNYFYGFSHLPAHKIDIPEQTFTVSCFRDPVARVVSHFNMLMEFRENNVDHVALKKEGQWLGEDFNDFLHRIPQEHLLNQLYMFSGNYNVNEAVSNVQKLSHYFFTEAFGDGIHDLNKKTGLRLEPIHIRQAGYHSKISEDSLNKCRELLDEEYKFLDRIRPLTEMAYGSKSFRGRDSSMTDLGKS
jgi:hypothetical protein